jgi:hypothetical protein
VVELLAWVGADAYYSARGSFEYMREDGVFPLPDVPVFFQRFVPQPYPQVGSPGSFVPYLSVLDALMNVGAAGTADLIERGTVEWTDWGGMVAGGDADRAAEPTDG